jgi:hypothetical protein
MRVTDPIGGPPNLERYFRSWEDSKELTHYSYQLLHMVARYSRGDSLEDLHAEFAELEKKIASSDRADLERFPKADHLFEHRGSVLEKFRDALVVLSLGLCLRAQRELVADVYELCDHGDPLLETIAGAALALRIPTGSPAFYDTYDRLYDALGADGDARARCIKEYLNVWYSEKMEGMMMKDVHLIKDSPDYVGYWCFEAAGVVAALNIDDRTFAGHPHYPRDLVNYYRSRGE